MAKAEYRSSLRSKALIKNAAVQLLAEKRWDKITVTDIVKKADINRGTFYAHYVNPLAVFQAIEDDVVSKVLSMVTATPILEVLRHPLPMLKMIEQYIDDNPSTARIIFSSDLSGPLVFEHKRRLSEFFLSQVRRIPGIKDLDHLEVAIKMVSTGAIDTYIAWIAGTIPMQLEQVSLTIDKVIRNSLSPFLPKNQEGEPSL